MLLITGKPGGDEYALKQGKIFLVVAVEDGRYVVYDKVYNYFPYSFDPQTVTVVYGEIPSNWVKRVRGHRETVSFPEWADDPYFYSYLIDDLDPVQVRKRKDIIELYVKKNIDEYAKAVYGSVDNAVARVSEWYWSKDKEYRYSRGWEQHGDYGSDVELGFDNIYQSSHE